MWLTRCGSDAAKFGTGHLRHLRSSCRATVSGRSGFGVRMLRRALSETPPPTLRPLQKSPKDATPHPSFLRRQESKCSAAPKALILRGDLGGAHRYTGLLAEPPQAPPPRHPCVPFRRPCAPFRHSCAGRNPRDLAAASGLRRSDGLPQRRSGAAEHQRRERTPVVRLDSCLRRNDGKGERSPPATFATVRYAEGRRPLPKQPRCIASRFPGAPPSATNNHPAPPDPPEAGSSHRAAAFRRCSAARPPRAGPNHPQRPAPPS